MNLKTEFGDVEPGQEFAFGNGRFRKRNANSAKWLNAGMSGYAGFDPGLTVTTHSPAIVVSDDLTIEIHTDFVRLATGTGTQAVDGPGYLDVPSGEVPALTQALIKTQKCPLCAIGNTDFGPNHDGKCDKYTPF